MNTIKEHRNHRVVFSALIAAALVATSYPAASQLKDICLPGIGEILGSPPIMDGKPQDDPGWNAAGQLALGQSTVPGVGGVPTSSGQRNGNFQYGVKSSNLYLSVDLDNSTYSPGPNTTVIVVLSPDGTAANDWRLHINQFGGLGTVPTVTAWKNSDLWNTPTATNTCGSADVGHASNCGQTVSLDATGTVPAGCAQFQIAGARFTKSTTSSTRWGLELQIPYSSNPADASSNCKLFLPPAPGTFKAYFNVVSINNLLFSYTEDPWPTSSPLQFSGGTPSVSNPPFIERSTPPPATSWGVASLGTRSACKGVGIISAGVRQTPTGSMSNTSKGVTPEASGFYQNNVGTDLTTVAQCEALPNNYRWSGTQQSPNIGGSNIASPDNYFVAVAQNGSGAPLPASTLSTKFYLAPWGLSPPGDWDLIGKRYDPDSPGGNDIFQTAANTAAVTDGASSEMQTDWRLSYKESCAYSISGLTSGGTFYKGHHCVQAELVSTDPATNFTKKSLQFNHNVVPASRAEQRARIGTKGYGPPPAGRSHHEILLGVDHFARQYTRDGNYYYPRTKRQGERLTGGTSPTFDSFGAIPAELLPNGMTEALVMVARGYLITNDTIVINGTTYRRGQYIGAFSLEAGHNGAVDEWSVTMSPEQCPAGSPPQGCMTGSGNSYVLYIPEDEAVQVVATVEAREHSAKKLAVWLALGQTFPHGNFSNAYDGDFAGTLGFEYPIRSNVSVEATLALHSFDKKSTAPNLDVTQLGVNGKWYFPQSGWKPFVTLGLGAYSFDPGSTRLGVNAGAGVQYDIAPQWSVEGRYGLHAIVNNSPNSNYSTLQLGLRYSF